MAVNEILTRIARVRMGDDGIIRATIFPKAVQTLDDAKENLAAMIQVSGGRRCPVLVDTSSLQSIERSAQAYYASEEAASTLSALAMVTASPLSKMIGNFYLRLNKVHVPTRLVTSEPEAIEWLKGYLD